MFPYKQQFIKDTLWTTLRYWYLICYHLAVMLTWGCLCWYYALPFTEDTAMNDDTAMNKDENMEVWAKVTRLPTFKGLRGRRESRRNIPSVHLKNIYRLFSTASARLLLPSVGFFPHPTPHGFLILRNWFPFSPLHDNALNDFISQGIESNT